MSNNENRAGPSGFARIAFAKNAGAKKKGARLLGLLVGLTLVLSASCSIVFRSSIQGTIIDKESWDDGTTAGIADVKVFLYTKATARNEDFDAYKEGDDSTLPDRDDKPAYLYFQSTVTNADGRYDFTGFIWDKFFSEYGKTADRFEIFLLFYHPDYGLRKNPVPLYVVSDVTNMLPQIALDDLWNEGRLAGTVKNWKDGKGLANVSVNFYVAKSWTYDSAGNFANVEYPRNPTSTATSDTNGTWAATVRFPKKPDSASHKNKAPVRVSFVRDNYRCNDDKNATTLPVDSRFVLTDDVNRDGRTPEQGDYADAYILTELEYDKETGEAKLLTLGDVTMQRWRFSATVSGRVVVDGATPTVGVNGITVTLAVKGTEYSADSAPEDTASSTEDGRFNLGTITWEIGDGTGSSDWKIGEVDVTTTVTGATLKSGGLAELKPDVQRNITLKVTTP